MLTNFLPTLAKKIEDVVFCCSSAPRTPLTAGVTGGHNKGALGLIVSLGQQKSFVGAKNSSQKKCKRAEKSISNGHDTHAPSASPSMPFFLDEMKSVGLLTAKSILHVTAFADLVKMNPYFDKK